MAVVVGLIGCCTSLLACHPEVDHDGRRPSGHPYPETAVELIGGLVGWGLPWGWFVVVGCRISPLYGVTQPAARARTADGRCSQFL
jgi:hypothetical protein